MAVEREKGYSFRGWKLGEKVRLKEDEKEYSIIGFDEDMNGRKFIAIDKKCFDNNIKDSKLVTSCIDTKINYFEWVKEAEIEKIETDIENAKNQQQKKVLYGEEAVEYLRKNLHIFL